jgi:hypothetical protein
MASANLAHLRQRCNIAAVGSRITAVAQCARYDKHYTSLQFITEFGRV